MGARLLKDPTTASCRVFVGHLQSDETNKVELEQHFSKYGVVIGSLVNRGFGFVQFETEQAAQAAIKQEDGQIFKGRRIDVRPAKKDPHSHGDGDKPKPQGNQSFGQKNTSFQQRSNSFGSGNSTGNGNAGNNSGNTNFNTQKSNFGGGTQTNNSDMSSDDKSTSLKNPPVSSQEQFNSEGNKDQDNGSFQQFNDSNNESMNNVDKSRDNINENDGFNSGNENQNRGPGNNQYGGNNQNRGDDSANSGNSGGSGNNQSSGNQSGGNQSGGNPINSQNNSSRSGNNQGNQNRSGNNQNRNQNNQGGNQGQGSGGSGGGGGGGGQSRPRGNRGGKNKNKNRNDNSGGGNNYRDRSPINRGSRGSNDNKGGGSGGGGGGGGGSGGGGGGPRDWDHGMMPRNNNFGRDTFNDNGRFDDRFKDIPPMGGMNFDRVNDYPPVQDKNDCEIIVVNKNLTEYAEAIEGRLKKMGLTVDLLFPNEEVPLSRVLGNIANRGCLYAVVVTPINMDHHSMTLNILHGLPQEHRNMPVEDALGLINRDFSNYKSGGRAVPFNTAFANDRHPDAIQVLLNMLADNHQLTVLQFDRVLKYLEIKREEQVQSELGDTKDLGPTTIAVNDPKQAELQSRILNILNSNKPSTTALPVPSPVAAPNPVPVPSAVWATVSTTLPTSTTTTTVTPSPLLNDPTVQKALDSLLQGNLLKSIGDAAQTTPASSAAPQPLFAAFPNIDRF